MNNSARAVAPNGRSAHSDRNTNDAVMDAAVLCILERGFYRASSNEIARRAGVTWGVIQHHFGTREALMLAVLKQGADRFAALVAEATIDGETPADRLEQLMDVLAGHYGTPEYLAYMQVALNMDHDPRTSAEVRATMRTVAEASTEQIRSLVRAAVGPAADVPDLAATVFLALTGFSLSQQLRQSISYDATGEATAHWPEQRRLLTQMIAFYLQQVEPAAERKTPSARTRK